MASRSLLSKASSLGRYCAARPSPVTVRYSLAARGALRSSSSVSGDSLSGDTAGGQAQPAKAPKKRHYNNKVASPPTPQREPAEYPDHIALHGKEEAERHVRDNVPGGIDAAWKQFPLRHIGPRNDELADMLKELGPGAESMDSFLNQVIPEDVRLPPSRKIVSQPWDETSFTNMFNDVASANHNMKWMNGGGYYPIETPPVIRRNILESPAWYTSYTPYQAEISQGRLESLLNFQTMVSDLTGLPIANSSLLDEGTAAAEAMTLSVNTLSASRAKRPNKTYVVSHLVHADTIKVLHGRAEGFGINIKVVDVSSPDALQEIDDLGEDLIGLLVQYPDTTGGVQDHKALADKIHSHGALVTAATDLSALTVLTPPGEWGADIAVGNSQRFGVPLGFGGPHAAFMSVKESSKRRLPGRLVGVSKDRLGRRALRLALQTREQHIRREKATSNVCTAQALLANMAAMYAVYHGPTQLRNMAIKNVLYARAVAELAKFSGFEVVDSGKGVLSDTVTIRFPPGRSNAVKSRLIAKNIDCRQHKEDELVFACVAELGHQVFDDMAEAFNNANRKAKHSLVGEELAEFKAATRGIWDRNFAVSAESFIDTLPDSVRRTSSYLTHPVFNSYHSETEMLRYIHHLQSKDLSLTHAMIPLGSCTMKLNATSQMELISNKAHGNVHPLTRAKSHASGHLRIAKDLSSQLIKLTGMDAITLQPNSGAQGEFAGLRAIRKYHETQPGAKRDICLIPSSAHGTNPASAAMAGMRVVLIKCDAETGNLDMTDLKAKCEKHAEELGAIMITYPSTFGVFEPDIIKICKMVHDFGGQVYMDGANMNAQIGLTSPGALGADVCHLNLHKTFCIPHGGGGPGVGPISVKQHLTDFLPHQPKQVPVASARFGSASILPISWAYISTMGDEGLRQATSMALLNANYLLARLKPHYPILYTNDNGRCAHEFILDVRSFKATSGIEAGDIAKRLQDYGFHPPTLSWPVANTLMIEPTESESKQELDRLADALISIRQEIRDVEEGRQPREGNVLKMSPHPQLDVVQGDGDGAWNRPYTRQQAVYPVPELKDRKFWPSVARIDDTYGDMNLYCTCPPVSDYAEEQ